MSHARYHYRPGVSRSVSALAVVDRGARSIFAAQAADHPAPATSPAVVEQDSPGPPSLNGPGHDLARSTTTPVTPCNPCCTSRLGDSREPRPAVGETTADAALAPSGEQGEFDPKEGT